MVKILQDFGPIILSNAIKQFHFFLLLMEETLGYPHNF